MHGLGYYQVYSRLGLCYISWTLFCLLCNSPNVLKRIKYKHQVYCQQSNIQKKNTYDTNVCAHVNSSLTAVQKKEEGKQKESEKVAQRERIYFPPKSWGIKITVSDSMNMISSNF